MDRNALLLPVLVVLAALCISGCGERAMEPGGQPEMAGGISGVGSTAIDAAGGHGPGGLGVKGTLLVASRGGIVAMSPDGDSFLFHPYGAQTANIEVLGTRIFWYAGTQIVEFDHHGNILATTHVPARIGYGLGFTVLPDGNFAVMDCEVDSVYFLHPTGAVYQAVAMPEASPMSLQNMKGMVLDGKLIVSETGTRKIAQIDLTTYAATIFRDFSDPPAVMWFGDIDHQGPYFYVAGPNKLRRFTEKGPLRDVAELEDTYNLSGFAIVRHTAYAAFNFAGKVFEINISSGKAKCLLEGLDYPTDVEFIPVVLEPPVAARLHTPGGESE